MAFCEPPARSRRSIRRSELLGRVDELGKLSPDTVRGLPRSTTRAPGPKVRELIALAVAITTRCDGCIAVPSKAAVGHGAKRDRGIERATALSPGYPAQRLSRTAHSRRPESASSEIRAKSESWSKLDLTE
jgi:AhpD family alkylhydroperoxidase